MIRSVQWLARTPVRGGGGFVSLCRLCLPCLAFFVLPTIQPALADSQGTLLILQNPTNSSPRIVSLWGGAGSEQIIMKSDGTVWDWGFNTRGQLGNGNTNNTDMPGQVLGPNGIGYLTNLTAIMGGELHNFALKSDGTVWSWGWNYFGQLGDGSANWGYTTNQSTTPVQVFGLTSVKSLGGRGYHSLALKNDGTVWTWGYNLYGELGIGAIFNGGAGYTQGTNTPVQVIGLTNPAYISGGGFFSLALMSNGTVQAWGEGIHGECGNGYNTNCPAPVPVAGLSNIVAISGGWYHALALKSDGTVWAWGDNSSGEIGDNTTSNRYSPVQVVGLSNMVSVSGGDINSMALRADGTVWKWGLNQFGELGNGTSDTNAHPQAIEVPGLSNVVIAANRDYHNICVKRDGTVWVWGDDRFGGGGNFIQTNGILTPQWMPGLVITNTIPYAESFEAYAGGSSVVGTNYWSADSPASATVITTNYSLPYNGPLPIPGPHQNVLQVNGSVTNRFCPSYYSNVWADMMLQLKPPVDPPADPVNAAFAVGVMPDGRLAVWNCTNPPASGNGWMELLDTPIATNQFCRLTIEANYIADANGLFHYSVWVNGIASTNPATQYAAADSSQPWFGEIAANGNFMLDDLEVETNKSFYALQTAATGYGGSISPAGPVIVVPGSTNTFAMTASNWYTLASVTVDNLNLGTPGSYTFTNVLADHTIAAGYNAILAANNTPEWWLYQADTNWATNFNAAALSDPSGKGVPVWEDYIAGTDPTNPASVLALNMDRVAGQAVISLPTITTTPQYQSQRYYALESSTNLTGVPAWQGIPGQTNIPGLGQDIIYTNGAANPNAFYRCRVWLGP